MHYNEAPHENNQIRNIFINAYHVPVVYNFFIYFNYFWHISALDPLAH